MNTKAQTAQTQPDPSKSADAEATRNAGTPPVSTPAADASAPITPATEPEKSDPVADSARLKAEADEREAFAKAKAAHEADVAELKEGQALLEKERRSLQAGFAELEKRAGRARESVDKAVAAQQSDRAEYHVAGPGSIQFDGRLRKAGEIVLLTEDQAEDLGECVVLGRPRAARADIAKREAGIYRVAGPGQVRHGGKNHSKDDLIELSKEDARSLAEAVCEIE